MSDYDRFHFLSSFQTTFCFEKSGSVLDKICEFELNMKFAAENLELLGNVLFKREQEERKRNRSRFENAALEVYEDGVFTERPDGSVVVEVGFSLDPDPDPDQDQDPDQEPRLEKKRKRK